MSFDEVCCLLVKIPRLWYTFMTFVLYGIFCFKCERFYVFAFWNRVWRHIYDTSNNVVM